MPAPKAPASLDGLPLTDAQRARLGRLLRLIYDEEPLRDPKGVLVHAEAVFRRTVRKAGGGFVDLTRVRLGDGSGPVVELRA